MCVGESAGIRFEMITAHTLNAHQCLRLCYTRLAIPLALPLTHFMANRAYTTHLWQSVSGAINEIRAIIFPQIDLHPSNT